MVAVEPSPTAGGATPNTVAQVTGSLCVLRHHRQQLCTAAIPGRGGSSLAEVVVAPAVGVTAFLGGLPTVAEALPASAGSRRPLSVPNGSEPMT
jgi:hypothetical protein